MDTVPQSKPIIHDDNEKGAGENTKEKINICLLICRNVKLKVLMCAHISLNDIDHKS